MEQHMATRAPPCTSCLSKSLLKAACCLGLPVHHVVTDSSVQAGLAGALIHVNLAVDAVEPGQTLAGVHGDQVLAGGSVAAGAGLTLVYFKFTVDSWWRKRRKSVMME